MNRILIDVIAWLGIVAIAGGIFLNYGLGFSLIAGGALMIFMALQAAKVANNVSNG